MHISPIFVRDECPDLQPDLVPPLVLGPAHLAHAAFGGAGLADCLARIDAFGGSEPARQLDAAWAHELAFRPTEAAALQQAALAECRLFRVAGSLETTPLRVLAVMAPGDLMVNTPLDFITNHLDVRLDLLFVVPGEALPSCVPDHDVAFFAVSESAPDVLARLVPLFASWPRPVVNDPAAVARLSRDVVAQGLADVPGLLAPPVRLLSRGALLRHVSGQAPLAFLADEGSVLLRPLGSHAGAGLHRAETTAELAFHLYRTPGAHFHVTRFVDYRSADGMFRKYRVAFVGDRPFLCHMASSEHWMVHYLNAGMTEHAERRAEEARAMADFEDGFARRHAMAFAGLHAWMGLDYYQIDCAEMADGRLVVFEADVAAIIHLMDPPELFPYKPAQMRRVFAGFEAMLRECAGAAR